MKELVLKMIKLYFEKVYIWAKKALHFIWVFSINIHLIRHSKGELVNLDFLIFIIWELGSRMEAKFEGHCLVTEGITMLEKV